MAQETLTLRTMNNGGIIEAVDAALAKIAENIADINTPPRQAPRTDAENQDQTRLAAHVRHGGMRSIHQAPTGGGASREHSHGQGGRQAALVEAYSDTNPGQARFEGTMPAEMRPRSNKSANVTPFRAAAE